MSRIDAIFRECRAAGRTALMPFVTAGYPSLETTADVLPQLEAAGASIVELGFPFSDPIADGPVIAASMHEALAAGATPEKIFDLVRRVRPTIDLGLIAMVSNSIVERMGRARFVAEAAASGIDGLIVPDVDTDRAAPLSDLCAARELSFSLLIAPTTPEPRIEQLTRMCHGFVYVLARLGITGEQSDVPDIRPRVQAIRRYTDLPLAVGFGISTPEHVAAVTSDADAAIVGSALVRRMDSPDDAVAAARAFVAELTRGLAAV